MSFGDLETQVPSDSAIMAAEALSTVMWVLRRVPIRAEDQ
jgi:hypothetical protein